MAKPIERRRFFQLVGLGTSILPFAIRGFVRTSKKSPNVLFLFSDQHRASAMGCYGDPNVRTPNFDAFAGQGVRMNAAMSTTPVCCPYRASLMTGLYSHHHGMLSNSVNFLPQGPLLADTFKKAGYRTGYIGKWHLNFPNHKKLYPAKYSDASSGFVPPERHLGFDWWRLVNNAHAHFEYSYYIDDARQPTEAKEGWQPTAFTDSAMEFIHSKSRDEQPWFLTVSFGPPHTPYKAPEEFEKNYNANSLELQSNVPEGKAQEYARANLPGYYGMIESLDVEFGRILRVLDDLNMADDTVVVYSSDHGAMMGSHGYKVKRWPHDESARVPFLVRHPGVIPAAKVIEEPFGTPDIFPTLLGLCGLEIPEGLDGADFAPLLRGEVINAPRDHVFLQMHYGYVPWPGWRALRTKGYHYAETALGPWLLFDVRKDPFQVNNLVHDSGNADIVDEMKERLRKVMETSGDSWDVVARGEYDNDGDLEKWQPGGKKFGNINLGYDWPGKYGWPDGVDAKSGAAPEQYTLYQNYPNPFNKSTIINFHLPRVSNIDLAIYNQLGQKIKTLFNGTYSAGLHQLAWNAGDDFGNPVATGIYICEMRANQYNAAIKLDLVN